jgi:hypothetical protein
MTQACVVQLAIPLGYLNFKRLPQAVACQIFDRTVHSQFKLARSPSIHWLKYRF